MSKSGHRFSSLAVMLLVVSSSITFSQATGGKDHRDHAQAADKATVWHVRANGCAPGNDPPPGTNC